MPPADTWRRQWRHWLADGGLEDLFKGATIGMITSSLLVAGAGCFAGGWLLYERSLPEPPPAKQFSRIIDRHKEAGPSTMGRIRFEIQPRPERVFR